MNLPASFTEYTRALLGVEEYEKTGFRLAAGTSREY